MDIVVLMEVVVMLTGNCVESESCQETLFSPTPIVCVLSGVQNTCLYLTHTVSTTMVM